MCSKHGFTVPETYKLLNYIRYKKLAEIPLDESLVEAFVDGPMQSLFFVNGGFKLFRQYDLKDLKGKGLEFTLDNQSHKLIDNVYNYFWERRYGRYQDDYHALALCGDIEFYEKFYSQEGYYLD